MSDIFFRTWVLAETHKKAWLKCRNICSKMNFKDTCTGFLLGGIGDRNLKRETNFMIVDKDTSVTDIEECLKSFIKRSDIDIILITQNVRYRHLDCCCTHPWHVNSLLRIDVPTSYSSFGDFGPLSSVKLQILSPYISQAFFGHFFVFRSLAKSRKPEFFGILAELFPFTWVFFSLLIN